MPRYDEEPIKTADGKLLLLQSRGLYPEPYNKERVPSLRVDSLEITLWLLNAAGSGIIGNLFHDALKQLIRKARKRHHEYSAVMQQGEKYEEQDRGLISSSRPQWAPDPDRQLRDDLVELTYDILARYRQLMHIESSKLMSEIDVFFTENTTWAVVTRELRATRRTMVEIDLDKDVARNRHGNVKEMEGFPVTIWPL